MKPLTLATANGEIIDPAKECVFFARGNCRFEKNYKQLHGCQRANATPAIPVIVPATPAILIHPPVRVPAGPPIRVPGMPGIAKRAVLGLAALTTVATGISAPPPQSVSCVEPPVPALAGLAHWISGHYVVRKRFVDSGCPYDLVGEDELQPWDRQIYLSR